MIKAVKALIIELFRNYINLTMISANIEIDEQIKVTLNGCFITVFILTSLNIALILYMILNFFYAYFLKPDFI